MQLVCGEICCKEKATHEYTIVFLFIVHFVEYNKLISVPFG